MTAHGEQGTTETVLMLIRAVEDARAVARAEISRLHEALFAYAEELVSLHAELNAAAS